MVCYLFLYSNLPLGGFIRNMNILLGDILSCLFLFYILLPNNLVTNIVFPGKQGIYVENGIRPPFLFYKFYLIGQVLSAGFLNSLK